ncbi:DUF3592 domain-containing protein [Chloroflexota bacterium]
MKRYPVGKHVKVYHDPGNPGIAVLEPGIPNNNGGFWLVLIFVVMGVGMILLGIGLLGIFVFGFSSLNVNRQT